MSQQADKGPKKGKKAKQRARAEEDVTPEVSAPADDAPTAPLTRGIVGFALFVVALLTVALVGIWFKMDVNRVFDVPKALALKVGGAGGFLVWLLYALFGKGFGWRSFRLFSGPVFTFTAVVVVSTYLSIDTVTSIHGVYERQFGMHGFLACVGLYAITSSVLVQKRGALFGMGWLALVGGLIGTYALLQSQGLDPFPFFHGKPHTKVYSFLGNATFAGNALALIFPVSTVYAIVAATHTLSKARWPDGPGSALVGWLVGFAGILFLQIVPGIVVFDQPEAARIIDYKLTAALSFVLALGSAGFGTWGPKGMRLASQTARYTADAVAAGALGASAVGIVMGLLFTRTRGAWVGSAVAIVAGLALLPFLFRDTKAFAKIRAACWGSLALAAVVMGGYLGFAEKICGDTKGRCMLYARTIRSIPAAFDPNRTDYGKGQGTRKYLWTESPRVLVDHEKTLERLYEERQRYDANVETGALPGLVKRDWGAFRDDEVGFDKAWRKPAAWLFGIGVETYRFAFMSHKSKRLEALDPMTNHDNPHNNYLYILASFGILGLLSYLWLLWRLLSKAFQRFYDPASFGPDGASISERALAFGIVTSFFSYSVYSIAGFDSVACSVFLFFLLGCAAVLFTPDSPEAAQPLLEGVKAHWAELRKKDASTAGPAPIWAKALVALLGIGLLGHAVVSATKIYKAERAFVGSRTRSFKDKVANIQAAIDENPNESYYHQSLGSTYLDMARGYRQRAQQLSKAGDENGARNALTQVKNYAAKAETALYASLPHAWAPENIYISLFQVYYLLNDVKQAKEALRWALANSPHLGAVRANLAALELQSGEPREALENSKWVLQVEPKNATALRTMAQSYMALGLFAPAERVIAEAQRRLPKDRSMLRLDKELEKKRAAANSTTAAP